MKALDLLITLRDDYIHRELDSDVEEAIKELEKIVKEDSQDRLVELEALQKENQELKNRSCSTCKYGHTYHFDEDIECMKLGADTQGLYFEKDFYCKNWELKDERD